VLIARDMSLGHPAYAGGQDIRDRSFDFACKVVEFCKHLYQEGGVSRQFAPQLIDCSTSVAANLEEARGAESSRDFISKCSISHKESRETHVRLRVCERCRLGPPAQAADLVREGNELVAIISTIVKNARKNARAQQVARRRRLPKRGR
jgi:four helix bundle protein